MDYVMSIFKVRPFRYVSEVVINEKVCYVHETYGKLDLSVTSCKYFICKFTAMLTTKRLMKKINKEAKRPKLVFKKTYSI